jgi:hypothetical protein
VQLKGFVAGAYTLQSTTIDAQRCINLYPQMDESGLGKNIASLLSTPGLVLFADLGSDPIRGLIVTTFGRLFVVVRQDLREVMADGTSVSRGTLTSSAGRVGIADNGTLLMLVDGPGGYQYDLTANSLTVVADFPGGATVTFQDGYFIFNQPNTQVFWITGLNATTVDPLDFASAEGSPDLLLAVLSDHRELWLFGTESIEVWYDSGAELFPFARIDGAFIPHGIAAQYSPARLDNTIYWLGQDDTGAGMVWKATGYVPSRVSTFAMEQAIAKYPTIADATSWTYQIDGHAFYCLNFPSGGTTWVYDAASRLWHERAYSGTYGLERHRAEMHGYVFGKHIVSDYDSGKLYQLTSAALNDNGRYITKQRSAPYISNELKNLTISQVQIDINTGSAAEGQVEPQCMLQWSDDGGRTWSNEYWIGLGLAGDTKKRVIWRRLGRTRERVFQFKITDDYPVAINDAFIELQAAVS